MDIIPDSLGLTDEWKRMFGIIKDRAEHADEDDTFFLQVSSHPVISLFLVTGEEKDPTTGKKHVHLHYSRQDESYPMIVESKLQMEIMGFNLYKIRKGHDSLVNMIVYKKKLSDLCLDIDNCIKENHGVKCYEDGDRHNHANINVFYLHICDVLNIFINKERKEVIKVTVSTKLLTSISKDIINEFDTSYLRDCNRDFLVDHIDFIYYSYAYLGNNSFIPIRTELNNELGIFAKSSFFMTNDHFIMHQFGKLQEINQNGCGLNSKLAYRSI